jgi:diguanylate cyclase (GGDEF)-like protein/PAS domain S-box-containing protein
MEPLMNSPNALPEHLFRLMIEQNSVGIVLTDCAGRILHVNPRQLKSSGYTLNEVLGKNPRIFSAGDTPARVYEEMWATILAGNIWHGDLINRRKNGESYRELVRISPIRDDAGEITHFFAIKEENLDGNVADLLGGTLATFDPLTGLPNRAMLLNRVHTTIQDAQAASQAGSEPGDTGFAMLAVDLDRFRTVNEVYGHLAGDVLLQRIAARLKEAVRQTDTVARTDGNEFCLLLSGDPSATLLEELSRRLLSAIATPVEIRDQHLAVTASIGIARFPLDTRDAETLMQCAVTAMGSVKSSGGDGVCFYAPQADQQALEFADLTEGLRDVVQRNELVLHYQPRVDLKTGSIVGLEALVRWQHPRYGLIAPGRFIPVAEETGLIVNLSQWVIRAALEQQRDWRKESDTLLPVGVNLSLRHFRSGDLPNFIEQALAETGLPANCLELEISESTMMRDPTQAFVMVDRIRALGVRLALDDFGTGLSSLSYLSRLTVDAVKIDQTFVRDITSNPTNASIVAAIIAMAHKLGKRTVAVGVETEGQALQLRRHDCDEMQGYYFSKPLPAADAAALFLNNRNLALKGDEEAGAAQTLLLVDDEPNILNALKRLLRRDGYRVLTAGSGAEALELLAANSVQVIVSDHRMPEMSGVELLSRARDLYPHTRRIILSGYSDIGTLTEAINRGAVWKFISKPWEDEALKLEIKAAFEGRG